MCRELPIPCSGAPTQPRTVSPVSMHLAWNTTPKEPLPTTRSVRYRMTCLLGPLPPTVVITWPTLLGSPSAGGGGQPRGLEPRTGINAVAGRHTGSCSSPARRGGGPEHQLARGWDVDRPRLCFGAPAARLQHSEWSEPVDAVATAGDRWPRGWPSAGTAAVAGLEALTAGCHVIGVLRLTPLPIIRLASMHTHRQLNPCSLATVAGSHL